jgi:hypothetical protein
MWCARSVPRGDGNDDDCSVDTDFNVPTSIYFLLVRGFISIDQVICFYS